MAFQPEAAQVATFAAFDRPGAFACLRCLSARPMLLLLFRLDPLEWHALGELHASLLRAQLPHVASHLERLGMTPAMYLPEWLMPLWTRTSMWSKGRLGEAASGHHQLITLHLKARGCPPHS